MKKQTKTSDLESATDIEPLAEPPTVCPTYVEAEKRSVAS